MKKLIYLLFGLCSTISYAQTYMTDAEMTVKSNQIKNETVAGANTKERFAYLFQRLIDSKINVSRLQYAVATGTDAYTVTITPLPVLTGLPVFVYFDNTNTGASTLTVTGLTTNTPIVNNDGSAMGAGDIGNNEVKLLVYNGTNFQCVGGGGSSGGLVQGSNILTQNTTIDGDGTYNISISNAIQTTVTGGDVVITANSGIGGSGNIDISSSGTIQLDGTTSTGLVSASPHTFAGGAGTGTPIVINPFAGNPSGRVNGSVWINDTDDHLYTRLNGSDYQLDQQPNTLGSITGLGTGVGTALGINVGSAGAPVVFNGAGGTPSSITLTSGTGLPPTTGISGWPSNASGVLTNNGSGTLSWGAGGSGGWATSGGTTITTPTITGDATFVGTQTISGSGKYLKFDNSLQGGGGNYMKLGTSQDATYGSFNVTMAESVIDPEINKIVYMGWNTAAGGGSAVAGKASNRLGFESHYNGISADDYEYYYEVTPTAGSPMRHFSVNTNKASGVAVGYSAISGGYDFRPSNVGTPYAAFASNGQVSGYGSGAGLIATNTDTSQIQISPISGGVSYDLTGSGSGAITDGAPHFQFNTSLTGNTLFRIRNTHGTSTTGDGAIMALYYAGAERHYIQGLSSSHGTAPNGLLIRNLTANSAIAFYNGQYGVFIAGSGRVGINGVTSPTANIHLPAGTATASTAPLKFSSGTRLTTPDIGLI